MILNYINKSLLKKIVSNSKNESFSFKVWARSTIIIKDFVGLKLRIYNGREFIPLSIIPDMIGHKLGEFVPTRARYEFKKKKKKK